MEFVRNRLKTLHVVMLSMIGLMAVISIVYFSKADNGVYDATDVIGQYDPPSTTYPPSYTNGDVWSDTGSASFGFSHPSAIALDPTTNLMYVADTNSNRVSVYNVNIDGTIASIPTYIIGQPDATTTTAGLGASSLDGPTGVAIDYVSQILYVADTNNNRVLSYEVGFGIYTGMGASGVFGQPDFDTNTAGVGATSLDHPHGLDVNAGNNILYVADTNNNRVVVFEGNTTSSGAFGQPDLNSNTAGLTAKRFDHPISVEYTGTGILVSDSGNNRVLYFTNLNYATDPLAANVFGQADFTTATSGTTSTTLSNPVNADYDVSEDAVYIVDSGNNRILVYDVQGGISDGMAATYVMGQSNMTSASAAVTQSGLSGPMAIEIADSLDSVVTTFDPVLTVRRTLWVADASANRLLLYRFTTLANLASPNAYQVVGQQDVVVTPMGTTPIFTGSSAYSGDDGPNDLSFSTNKKMAVDTNNHRLFVQDRTANRVLIFNLDADNELIDRVADNVIGQSDFTSAGASPTQSSFQATVGLAYDMDNDRLFVGDANRVLLFDVRPAGSPAQSLCGFISTGLSNGMNASCVFGQSDFTSNGSGNVGLPAIIAINALAYDSVHDRLFVSSAQPTEKIRVFDLSGAIANNMATTYDVGNAYFYVRVVDIAYDSLRERLFVAVDRIEEESSTWGSIVWVYDVATITPYENPVNVLGTVNTQTNEGILTDDHIADDNQCTEDNNYPTYDEHWTAGIICDSLESIAFDTTNNRLYVATRSFGSATRITVFDTQSITDGEDAVAVLGQVDFTSEVAGGVTQSAFSALVDGMVVDERSNKLYVGVQNRVLVYDFVRPVYTDLPSGTVGQAYSAVTLATENGQGTESLAVVSGLPPGMSFDTNTLQLSGTPTTSATYSLVLRASDAFGVSTFVGNRTYQIQIAGAGGGDPIPECTDAHANNFGQQNTCEYDPPTLAIVSPASSGTYTSTTNTIVISGTSSDNDIVTSVVYSLNGGSPVTASNTSAPTAWTTTSLTLVPGSNTFTVTASNNHSLQTTKTLTIVYGTTPPETCATNPSLSGCGIVVTPPTLCLDATATNYNQPIPCTYPQASVDVCVNIAGTQSVVPSGYELTLGICTLVPVVVDPGTPPVEPGGGGTGVVQPPVEPRVLSVFTMVASRIGLIVGLFSTLFAGAISLAELAFLPQRIWQLILGAIGFKRRIRRWGTVYDSVTKQPLDPVYVTISDTHGKEVATSITDIDGRYGFLVLPGVYKMVANKTNYQFPSRQLAGKTSDEVYSDLYFGTEFTVREGDDAIAKNIPMDPLLFNWNEYIKHEQKLTKWNAKRDKIMNRIANTLFIVGFIASLVAAVIAPTTYNKIVIAVYIVLLLIRELGVKVYRSGFVSTKEGNPVAYGIVHFYSAKLKKKLFTRPLDKYGRYYALAPKGDYYVSIEIKNSDQTYTPVFQSETFTATRGVINKKFIIS